MDLVKALNLTMEQQFALQKINIDVESMTSLDQAKEFIIELARQNMLKDNVIREALKQKI